MDNINTFKLNGRTENFIKIIYRYPGEIVKILGGGYNEIIISLNITKFN